MGNTTLPTSLSHPGSVLGTVRAEFPGTPCCFSEACLLQGRVLLLLLLASKICFLGTLVLKRVGVVLPAQPRPCNLVYGHTSSF